MNPVQLPTQKGRRGLGFASREPRESFVLDWDPEQEEVNITLKGTFRLFQLPRVSILLSQLPH